MIDDIPSIYSLLGIYLSSLHIKIISTTNAEGAIEIYKKQKDKIDLLIVDLNLFNNDINLIKKLRESCNDCIIISKSSSEKSELSDYHLHCTVDKDKLILILNEIWQK